MEKDNIAQCAIDTGIVIALALLRELIVYINNRPKETNETVAMINDFHSGKGEEWLKNRELELNDEVIRDLMNGFSPMNVWPTREEMETIKQYHNIRPGKVHIAIAGLAGSGKSTLINAFRGLSSIDNDSAEVGITETTTRVQRYEDRCPDRERLVWYDIPGAGTQEVPSPKYFIDQGLFIFDAIIVNIDSRVMTTDIDILKKCASFPARIPTIVVRSKADQHIDNIMKENRNLLYGQARDIFTTKTRASYEQNCRTAGLDNPPKLYIISAHHLRDMVKGVYQRTNDRIDELDLFCDVLKTVKNRRY